MMGVEFCQWSRTICQLVVLGVGIFLFMRTASPVLKRKEGRRQGTVKDRCLSLESSYIPVKLRRDVLERDNYKCFWCREPEKHDVGHLWPKCLGGDTSFWNVVTQCKICKRKKHYDSPPEFISKLKIEELDVFKDITMKIKVIFKNGEEAIGLVDKMPSFTDKGFYLRYEGNGNQEPILMSEVHRVIPLEGIEKK